MAHTRSIFVNIVVSDLPRALAFYEAIGFTFNPQFTDEAAACMVVNEGAYFMIHTPTSMKRFSQKPPCDHATHLAGIYAFSVGSRAEVDAVADRAVEVGGKEAAEPVDMGFMFYRSFTDPDGHSWEVLWMDPAAAEGGPPEQA